MSQTGVKYVWKKQRNTNRIKGKQFKGIFKNEIIGQ